MTKMNLPSPLAFMPPSYTDGDSDREIPNDADDQVRPLDRGRMAGEPEGAWDQNQKARGALPADTSGKVTKRVQTGSSPAGRSPQLQAKVDLIKSLTGQG
jgi:hypothetical protein